LSKVNLRPLTASPFLFLTALSMPTLTLTLPLLTPTLTLPSLFGVTFMARGKEAAAGEGEEEERGEKKR